MLTKKMNKAMHVRLLKQVVNKLKKIDIFRKKKTNYFPEILSHDEAIFFLTSLKGIYKLISEILYFTGIRGFECLKLRILDIDFKGENIYIRNIDGSINRIILLPKNIIQELKTQIDYAYSLYLHDKLCGIDDIYLPKYLLSLDKKSGEKFEWQYLFPSSQLSKDKKSDSTRRSHIHLSSLNRAIYKAKNISGINKNISSQTLRNSYTSRLLERGEDISIIYELLGHKHISITKRYINRLRQ